MWKIVQLYIQYSGWCSSCICVFFLKIAHSLKFWLIICKYMHLFVSWMNFIVNIYLFIYIWWRRVIGISRSVIWSKSLMELIFSPCGEFRWSPEVLVSQIHSPHPTLGPLGSFNVCLDAKERVGCRKHREATAPIQSLVKLQPWFLSLRWKTCLRQNYSLGFCACSEGPALGQNTLMIFYCSCKTVGKLQH